MRRENEAKMKIEFNGSRCGRCMNWVIKELPRSSMSAVTSKVCTMILNTASFILEMKIAPLGLAGGRLYDRTNSLRTPTMKESQLLREKTTSSVFLSTCSNAVHAQFH